LRVFSVDVLAPDASEKIRYWVDRKLTALCFFTAGSTMERQCEWLNDPRAAPASPVVSARLPRTACP
jgi:hypothetical protein